MTIELTQTAPLIIHVEATPPTEREQLEARLRLTIGMIAVIEAHIIELQENPALHAAIIDSRNRQKDAYLSEQRNLESLLNISA